MSKLKPLIVLIIYNSHSDFTPFYGFTNQCQFFSNVLQTIIINSKYYCRLFYCIEVKIDRFLIIIYFN